MLTKHLEVPEIPYGELKSAERNGEELVGQESALRNGRGTANARIALLAIHGAVKEKRAAAAMRHHRRPDPTVDRSYVFAAIYIYILALLDLLLLF